MLNYDPRTAARYESCRAVARDDMFASSIESAVREMLPPLLKNAPWKLHSQARTIEIETKIDIQDVADARSVLLRVSELELLSWNSRREIHELYPTEEGGSLCRITFLEGEDVWIKEKRRSKILTTPGHMPFIVREGFKFKPCDVDFGSSLKRIRELECLSIFSKRCINVFFRHLDSIFSLSYSLASDGDKFHHYQMEFEHEDAEASCPLPIHAVLQRFDHLFHSTFYDLIPRLNAVSKLERLASAHNANA